MFNYVITVLTYLSTNLLTALFAVFITTAIAYILYSIISWVFEPINFTKNIKNFLQRYGEHSSYFNLLARQNLHPYFLPGWLADKDKDSLAEDVLRQENLSKFAATASKIVQNDISDENIGNTLQQLCSLQMSDGGIIEIDKAIDASDALAETIAEYLPYALTNKEISADMPLTLKIENEEYSFDIEELKFKNKALNAYVFIPRSENCKKVYLSWTGTTNIHGCFADLNKNPGENEFYAEQKEIREYITSILGKAQKNNLDSFCILGHSLGGCFAQYSLNEAMEVSLQSLRASSIPQKAVKLELVAYNSPRANLRRILNVTNNAAELAAIYNNPVSVTYFDRHNDLIQRAGEYKTLADLDSEYGEVNYKVMFHAIGNDENFSDMIKTHAHVLTEYTFDKSIKNNETIIEISKKNPIVRMAYSNSNPRGAETITKIASERCVILSCFTEATHAIQSFLTARAS